MKGVEMYHMIKAYLSQGKTIRETGYILGISPGTVHKYSKMDLATSSVYLKKVKRKSQFEIASSFIEEELQQHPQMKSTKLLRKIRRNYPEITIKVRALRDFIKPIREKYKNNQQRFYRPVINHKEGGQVQVDPGEYTVKVDITGRTMKVYFIVFVFSYSRMMFVTFQERPYKTDDFLKAHLEAFRFFGGVAKEYVYDQTKLVVIEEKYREVWFNEKFNDFALRYEFLPVVCEGYDPESKGKVERSVSYVKDDFLYGDYFTDIESVRRESTEWLNNVANVRIHAVTNQKPAEMFAEEKAYLKANTYHKDENIYRQADKTGLISYQGNKYSVPLIYQNKQVIVKAKDNKVIICRIEDGQEIASHFIPKAKGKQIINNNHYRDIRKNIQTVKAETLELLKEISSADLLLSKIEKSNPKYFRDQLAGIQKLSQNYPENLWEECVPKLLELDEVRTSLVEKMLSASRKRQILVFEGEDIVQTKSTLDRPVKTYMRGVKNA